MCLLKSLYRYRYFILHLLCSHTQREHIFRWIKSLQPDYLLDQLSPWLTFDAIEFLKPRLREGMRVFEYSSGGSTLFWLRYGALCVSIEHNPDWYKLMHHRLKGMEKIDYRLVLPEPAEDKGARDIADPNRYLSEDVLSLGYNFRDYVCQLDPFPDNYFDIVSIDGRARPSCLMHSVTKVKVGGMLILDNAERSYYFAKTKDYLENYEKKEFFGVGPVCENMWKTNIYLRIR